MKIGDTVYALVERKLQVGDWGHMYFQGLDVVQGEILSIDDDKAVLKLPTLFSYRLEIFPRKILFLSREDIVARIQGAVPAQ